MNGVLIRPAAVGDAAAIAELHASCITEGFLPRLGARFLRLLYAHMIGSGTAQVFVAEADGIAGFVSGTADPGELMAGFSSSNRVAIFRALAPVLARPAVAMGALETRRHMRAEAGSGPELLAMAVAERSRGTGVATGLERALEDHLRAAGATSLAVVFAKDDAGARSFYEAQGFTPERRLEVHRGTASLRYSKVLSTPPA